MEAKELFVTQFDDAAKQLRAVLSEWPDSTWDTKAHPTAMSARETVTHLTEAYQAAGKHLIGEEHQWGSYAPVSDDPNRLLAEMNKQRDVLKAAALGHEDSHLGTVLAYSSNHDFYHVGQLVTLRLHLNPEWDAYSIYS